MRRRRAAALAAPWALAALLAGCGSAPTTPATAETVEVPGAPVTVVVPAGWSWSTQGSEDSGTELLARDASATGDPGFRANVVVTARPAERTLDDEGAAALTAADALPGWTLAATGGGRMELGGFPAFRLTGDFDSLGVTATQVETIVEVGTDADRTFVYVTTSVSPPAEDASADDARARDEAAAEAQSMVDSLAPAP